MISGGGFFNSITNAAARLARSAQMSDEVAGRTAKLLMSSDPASVRIVCCTFAGRERHQPVEGLLGAHVRGYRSRDARRNRPDRCRLRTNPS